MPLSTSNSDHLDFAQQRRPVSTEGKLWGATLLMVCLSLLAWEWFLRNQGHRPSVVDDQALWSMHREAIDRIEDGKVIVCLGDCRMQLGFVPDLLKRLLPKYRVVQLAVEGTSPIATLEDLAAAPDFNGIVLCGMTPREFSKDIADSQMPYVDYYHHAYTFNNKVNRFIATALQESFVCIHPQLRLDDLLVHYLRSQSVRQPHYIVTHADRARAADYSRVDLQAHRKFAVDRLNAYLLNREAETPEQWLDQTLRICDAVQAIQERGGEVAFVRFPTSGEHYRKESYQFPKEMFWDAFSAETTAAVIHFKDVPELAEFACPDYSHLDQRDAPAFTLALITELHMRGVLPSSETPTVIPPKPKRRTPEMVPEDFDPFAL